MSTILIIALLMGRFLFDSLPPNITNSWQYLLLTESVNAGVPPYIAFGVVEAESDGNPYLISANYFHHKAVSYDMGLCQLNTNSIKWLVLKFWDSPIPFNVFNPSDSVKVEVRYLRWLYVRYGNWLTVLEAYNAGIGRVDRHDVPMVSKIYAKKILSGWELK